MLGCACSSRRNVMTVGAMKSAPRIKAMNNRKVSRQPLSLCPNEDGFCAGKVCVPLDVVFGELIGGAFFVAEGRGATAIRAGADVLLEEGCCA